MIQMRMILIHVRNYGLILGIIIFLAFLARSHALFHPLEADFLIDLHIQTEEYKESVKRENEFLEQSEIAKSDIEYRDWCDEHGLGDQSTITERD